MVDVWLIPSETVACSSDLIGRYSALLSEAELERIARYYAPQERHVRLITRAALRGLLARYTRKDGRDWRFTRGVHGRPGICQEDAHAAIQFNVSHAGGLVALCITLFNGVGVDVEDARRINTGDVLTLARRFFSPAEALDIESQPPCSRRKHFFDYWTLKEAYVKALGTGLSTPLDQASFGWQDDGNLTVALGQSARDDGARWHFLLATIPPERRLAIAVRARSRSLRIRLFAAIPLVGERLLAELVGNSPGRRVALDVSPEDALS